MNNKNFYSKANIRMTLGKERAGQAYYNAAYEIDPDWAIMIRCTANDPYYDDSKVATFIELWENDH